MKSHGRACAQEIEAGSAALFALARNADRGIAGGQKAKVFRSGVDPMQLYISIAALGYFFCSNIRSLSVIFASDLASPAGMKRREEHVIEVVMSYLSK